MALRGCASWSPCSLAGPLVRFRVGTPFPVLRDSPALLLQRETSSQRRAREKLSPRWGTPGRSRRGGGRDGGWWGLGGRRGGGGLGQEQGQGRASQLQAAARRAGRGAATQHVSQSALKVNAGIPAAQPSLLSASPAPPRQGPVLHSSFFPHPTPTQSVISSLCSPRSGCGPCSAGRGRGSCSFPAQGPAPHPQAPSSPFLLPSGPPSPLALAKGKPRRRGRVWNSEVASGPRSSPWARPRCPCEETPLRGGAPPGSEVLGQGHRGMGLALPPPRSLPTQCLLSLPAPPSPWPRPRSCDPLSARPVGEGLLSGRADTWLLRPDPSASRGWEKPPAQQSLT